MSSRQALTQIITQKSIHLRAIKIALIVGTLLCLINQGDTIITGDIQHIHWPKILLTYLVPYAVSLYSTIAALSQQPPTQTTNPSPQKK